MSGFRAVGLVTVRELRERGLSKSYLVSWLILALLIGAGFAVPALVGGDDVPTHRLGVVGEDSARTVEAARSVLRGSDRAGMIEASSFDDREDAIGALIDEQVDAVLVGDRELVLGESASPQMERLLQQGALRVRLEEMTESGEASERVVELLSGQVLDVSMAIPRSDEDSKARQFLIGQAALVLLFMAIMMTGSWVLLGVTEEKTSRVVEVLLAAVRPWHLLSGKIVGVGILGLPQFGVVAGGLVMGIRLVFGADLIREVDGGMLATLLLWFVLGYAVYAVAYAAVGAVTSRPEDAQNAAFPMTMVALIGYLVGILYVGNHPEAPLSVVLSLVPMTAPFVIPVRAVSDSVAVWEQLLSVVVTMGFGWWLIRAAGRIYAGGVFKYQSRVKLREAFRSAEF